MLQDLPFFKVGSSVFMVLIYISSINLLKLCLFEAERKFQPMSLGERCPRIRHNGNGDRMRAVAAVGPE